MKKLRRTRALIAALFLSLILAAPFLNSINDNFAMFPLYHWAMFVNVPGDRWEFDVMIENVDGRALSPPVSLFQLVSASTPIGGPRVDVVGRLIGYFGSEFIEKNNAGIERYKALLETIVLRVPGRRIEYSLRLSNYDVLEKYRSGTDKTSRTLVRYAVERK